MKKLVLFMALAIMAGLTSCEKEMVSSVTDNEGVNLKRMPYYQYTYFLDKQGNNSHVYEVDYDFQGLTGEADLSPLVYVSGGSHMTVTPSTVADPDRRIVIVNNGGNGKVYFVPVTGHPEATADNYLAPQFGLDLRIAKNGKKVRITQVDFDQNNKLFIAGGSGFFEVYYAAIGDGSKTPIGYDVWNANPEEHVLWAKAYDIIGNTNADVEVMGEEEAEDIAEEYVDLGRNFRHPKFMGGDILFTQNSEETDGFEKEMLISFTQWGDRAMFVEFSNNKATANHLFHLRRSMPDFKNDLRSGKHKVTGAALVGDNLLMTSHHLSTSFSIWNLNGEEVARPALNYPSNVPNGWRAPSNGAHNWGDMASFQRFDHALGDMSLASDRIIDGDYTNILWPASHLNKVLAEVKRYNPRGLPNHYEPDNEDNPGIDKEGRQNGANADIADLRFPAVKFASLGTKGGSMILRFRNTVEVNENTKLQVSETSHRSKAEYDTYEEAWEAFKERANVYVSKRNDKYIGSWTDDSENWVHVGVAKVENNIFELPEGVEDFTWIKIVDDNSEAYDGFDVNFVAAFEQE